MASQIIALDHPIDVNGINLRSIPVRAPTTADHNEATRLSLRKRDGAKAALVKALTPFVEKQDMQKAVAGFALMRCISGLSFEMLVRLETVDQEKFRDFIVVSTRGVGTNG